MTDHQITPPPELVQQWCHEEGDEIKTSPRWYQIVATKAARWGADQELEACCEWMRDAPFGLSLNTSACQLRAARRPKPPTLKEQALTALSHLLSGSAQTLDTTEAEFYIRRALEALPND